MQQQIDFPMETSVLKFQAWQFDEKPAFEDEKLDPSHI